MQMENQMVEKYYNEYGQVGVLYSPGYGAGWSSWNCYESKALEEYMLFDKELVSLVLKGKRQEAAELVERVGKERFNKDYVCVLGARDLQVAWLDTDEKFQIREYDGSESIEYLGEVDYFSA